MTYSRIYKYLEDLIGLNIDSIGIKNIKSSINAIISETQINSIDEFAENLENSDKLKTMLFEKIIVPETWFFRDNKSFTYLNIWLKKNKKLYANETLRILSVPCSTGEEAYSIAMTLIDAGLDKKNIQIDAIDLSKESIAKAKIGKYSKISFRSKNMDYIDKYFKNNDDKKCIQYRIQEMVNFRQDNILHLSTINPSEKYHIIYFKNLLIYLSDEARMIVLKKICSMMHPDGILFTGHTEAPFFLQYDFESVKFPHSFAMTLSKPQLPEKKEKVIDITQNNKKINTRTNTIFKQNYEKIFGSKVSSENIIINKDNRIEYKKENQLKTIRQLADKGYFVQALEKSREYSQNNSTDPEGYFFQGIIFEGMNDSNNAIIQYNKVLYLEPSHNETLLQLSLLYDSLGLKKQAKSTKDRLNRITNNNE